MAGGSIRIAFLCGLEYFQGSIPSIDRRLNSIDQKSITLPPRQSYAFFGQTI